MAPIHAAFPVISVRFEDYMPTPKANGYQSTHTGVPLREVHNQKIEVHVRTANMHEIAKAGLVAHWLFC